MTWTVWKWARKPGRGKNVPKHMAFSWQQLGTSKFEAVATKRAESAGAYFNHVAITSDGKPPSWNPNEPHNHKVDGICKGP